MMSKPIWVLSGKEQWSAIVASPAINKKTIYNAKSLIWRTNTQKPKLSKTLAVDSTISVKGLNPYWTEQSKARSSNLWLPTKTASQDENAFLQDTQSCKSHKLSNQAVEKSWFSSKIIYPQNKNLLPTYSISCMSSPVECMDLEIIKTKSVKLYPNPSQKIIWANWLDTSRWVYNWTIDFLKSAQNWSPNWMEVKKYATQLLPQWTKTTPFQIKGIAIKEAVTAFYKAKGKPKYRSRKFPMQSCFIPKSALKTDGIYPRISGKGLVKAESLPEIPLDSRLIRQYGEWFLSVPYKVKQSVAENQGLIVALDPGVRCFQTFYSETSAGHIGYNDFGRIQRLCFHLDDLISRTSKATGKQKREMKQAQNRIRKTIKNLIKELHHKTAIFLVKNFDVILLPTFSTQQMAKKGQRKLRSKTVRAMLTWSHYKFKMHLNNKALEFGKQVIEVCEAYTSKTASWTGEIKNVGGSRAIRSGGITLERDLNGARGIFVRSLGDSPALMELL